MQPYLQPTSTIDWQHPAILAQAQRLAASKTDSTVIAQACFEWVRDAIRHSADYQQNPVTCRASDVLRHRTGYCFAKSHLLAALLRANGIPAGFCYQRLRLTNRGTPYSLHGFNAVYLPQFGWYRIDPRGNKVGINAQFRPPYEQLAYHPQQPGEMDLPGIFAEPLLQVVLSLKVGRRWDDMLSHLPDVPPNQWRTLVGA